MSVISFTAKLKPVLVREWFKIGRAIFCLGGRGALSVRPIWPAAKRVLCYFRPGRYSEICPSRGAGGGEIQTCILSSIVNRRLYQNDSFPPPSDSTILSLLRFWLFDKLAPPSCVSLLRSIFKYIMLFFIFFFLEFIICFTKCLNPSAIAGVFCFGIIFTCFTDNRFFQVVNFRDLLFLVGLFRDLFITVVWIGSSISRRVAD